MLVKDAIHFVNSDRDANFTDSLVTSASEYESLSFASVTGGHGRCWIKSVRLHTATNHAWTVIFMDRPGGVGRRSATPYGNAVIDFFKWAASDGIATATEYVYGKTGLNIPYQDSLNTGNIYVGLINDSASTKAALGSGNLPGGVFTQYVTMKIGVISAA